MVGNKGFDEADIIQKKSRFLLIFGVCSIKLTTMLEHEW